MYRVLLADDEQIERMALARRLMRRFGDSLQISEATDGKEAVELYQKEHSQIIIMDISMPELNGVEAAEQIRSMDEDCVIVFYNRKKCYRKDRAEQTWKNCHGRSHAADR